MTLEEAVRKCTALPAQTLRLRARGMVRVGAWADVLVIDVDDIASVSRFEDPLQYPKGIDHVIVNGVEVIVDGKHTGRTPGKMLRRR